MYQPYNEATASREDRVAWVLCQIIDDDAPMRWTRYRFAAECIAKNRALMADLVALGHAVPAPAPLTAVQVQELILTAGYKGHDTFAVADFINGIRHGEIAHGIGVAP